MKISNNNLLKKFQNEYVDVYVHIYAHMQQHDR